MRIHFVIMRHFVISSFVVIMRHFVIGRHKARLLGQLCNVDKHEMTINDA